MNSDSNPVGVAITAAGYALIFVVVLICRVIYLILRLLAWGIYYACYYATHPHRFYLDFLRV